MDAELSRRFMHFINQGIEILNLSTRTLRALKRNEITHVHQLMTVTMGDLAGRERMNHQSALETNDAMCEFGLSVGVFTKEEMVLLVPLWEQMVAITKVGDQEIAAQRDVVSGNKKIKDLKFLNRYDHIQALEKLGIIRIKDLAKITKSELYKISGLGKSSADKLATMLAVSGGCFRVDPGNADVTNFNRALDVVKAVSQKDPEGLWKLHLYHRLLNSRACNLLSQCRIERIEQLEGFDFKDLPLVYGRRIRLGSKSKAEIKTIAEIYGIELKE